MQIQRVVTDGGANMVATKFQVSLPSWDVTNEDFDEYEAIENDKADGVVHLSDESLEELEMLETGHSQEKLVFDGEEELAEEFSLDPDLQREFDDIEFDFENSAFILPPNPTLPSPRDKPYILLESLRSTCVAHSLQLVIKDGLSSMEVLFPKLHYLIIKSKCDFQNILGSCFRCDSTC